MIPLKPNPKAAAMANRPTSSCVSRKDAMATAWNAEPTITVRSPPMRSASAPHAWRATKADASITDSMTAPWAGLMPMPLQKATRCAEGIAMGTQQRKPARQNSAWTRFGCRPATRLPRLADIEGPDRTQRGKGEACGHHAGGDGDGGANADAVRQPTHQDTAGPRA